MASFSDRLKQLRNEKGLLQRELAEHLKLSRVAITQYENGNRVPDQEIINKIADYFGVSLDYLMGKTDIRNPYIPDEYAQKHKVTKRDLTQYEDFIEQAGIFFMDDEVAEEDKEKLFRDISELFWKAKEMNKKKYGRKKKAKTE